MLEALRAGFQKRIQGIVKNNRPGTLIDMQRGPEGVEKVTLAVIENHVDSLAGILEVGAAVSNARGSIFFWG
eukprot:8635845-Alexandrium_andersonii.AAC.1